MDFRKGQNFLGLDGQWSFAYSDGLVSRGLATEVALRSAGLEIYPCTVPGNFELDLLANGIIEDPFPGMNIARLRKYENSHVWYFRRFEASEQPDREAVLVFEGLDCFAEIYLNGRHIGSCDNMLIEYLFPVDGLLRGENELLVHIRPAVEHARRCDYPPSLHALASNYESLHVRKAPHMYGWDIMPRAVSAGIWRPVRLRFLPNERLDNAFLENLWIAADGESGGMALYYRAKTFGDSDSVYEVVAEGRCGESVFYAKSRMLFDAGMFHINVSKPRLWWPKGRGGADLYDVTVTLLKNGEELDRLTFTHGIKTVELERTSVTDAAGSGAFCFKVNGEKVFIKGTNWVPADAFHSRDASRIPAMFQLADDLGCNMTRCWGGNVYENDIFFDLCDRNGIMVWQDFAMACGSYPQDDNFRKRLEVEARTVVRRLRQHACLALWSGDNECDSGALYSGKDPNWNVLTREALPRVLREENPGIPYIPSSPYIDSVAYKTGEEFLPENHLWGPRSHFKSDYYRKSLCHFVSEIGYHGCPKPESVRRFISAEKMWPYSDNEEWKLHATSPIPGVDLYDYRVGLMAHHLGHLFGKAPDNLEDFAFASQAAQGEALKFFIELFRSDKWRRTGIIWWNLIDGWPQFSDAVVDYYFGKKLAYDYIKRAQVPLLLVLNEPQDGKQDLVACNDTRNDLELRYSIKDLDTGEIIADGSGLAKADEVTVLTRIPSTGSQRFYIVEWSSPVGEGISHYLAGEPPFELETYRGWLRKSGLFSDADRWWE